jgi:hemerythrin
MVAWKNSWNFNIPSIDRQHTHFIKAINALDEYLGEDRIRLDIRKLIMALNNYTKVHFSHEESLMKQVNYSQLEEHRQEHVVFLEKLLIFETKADQESVSKDDCEIFKDYLNEWLTFHILGSDRKYVDLFKKHDIQ